MPEHSLKDVGYYCAWCNTENQFNIESVLRCNNCGNRIFYKKKIPQGVQYEAR